jgi:hypothetical protein
MQNGIINLEGMGGMRIEEIENCELWEKLWNCKFLQISIFSVGARCMVIYCLEILANRE